MSDDRIKEYTRIEGDVFALDMITIMGVSRRKTTHRTARGVESIKNSTVIHVNSLDPDNELVVKETYAEVLADWKEFHEKRDEDGRLKEEDEIVVQQFEKIAPDKYVFHVDGCARTRDNQAECTCPKAEGEPA